MKFIKFERSGCIPCKKMDKILQSLNVEVEHKNLDIEECDDLLAKYNISSVPVLVKIKDDKEEMLYGINHTMEEFKRFLELA